MHHGVDSVVDPMEVFSSMSASLLERQPKPFNPIYNIKPTPVAKLKIGGKPPREIFYRDTLTFMTSLPPPVQPKTCSCQFLCNGNVASIICHSCSIYDPTKAAYYCDLCFPARHPWYRVPHLSTKIENDESIAHTLKIAHRIAEASRYDNEGKSILLKVQKQKPNLAFVGDDEKVDNQLREYGRKVVALEEHVQQMRARLQQDIMFGDVIPLRKSVYSAEKPDTDSLLAKGDEFGPNTTPAGIPLLQDLRATSFGMSEPLFSALNEEEAPETMEFQTHTVKKRTDFAAGVSGAGAPQLHIRAPFVRGDTAESTDSLTISPMEDGVGFFRESSNVNTARIALQAIEETDSVYTEPAEASALRETMSSVSYPTGLDDAAVLAAAQSPQSNMHFAAAPQEAAVSPGMRRVLSGISFTSVAHSDIDSVYSSMPHNVRRTGGNSDVTAPIHPAAEGQPPAPEQGSSKKRSTYGSNWLSSIESVNTEGSVSTLGTGGGSAGSAISDITTMSKSSCNIQRVFKGYLARRTVSKMLTTRLVRVFSLEANRDYFYDKTTGASSWVPPKLLHADHLEELQYIAETVGTKLWACKRACPRHREKRVEKRKVALKILQGFARCILSRRRVLRRADAVYRRVWDGDSSTYYYANAMTGETAWTKSSVYLHASSEPPVYAEGGGEAVVGSAQSESVKRRSPRHVRVA